MQAEALPTLVQACRRERAWFPGFMVLLALFTAGPACADDPAPATARPAQPCEDPATSTAPLDRLRAGLYSGACATSRWFDGLFGDGRDYAAQYDQSYGRAGVGFAWDPVDELRLDAHLRASLELPVLGDRFNAVIGREKRDVYITESADEISYLPGYFSDEDETDWYAGLNYNASAEPDRRFDVGAGVQIANPVNPYLKARYRYDLHPADRWLVTARTTAFWEDRQGFGTTLALDNDWALGERSMLRWANTLTRSEATDGLRWKTRLAFYQALDVRSAVRYEGMMHGDTGGIQPDRKELRVTYRQSVLRTWFFLETFGGVFWAESTEPDQRCSGCAMAGLGFEIMFGRRYDDPGPLPSVTP